MYIDYIRNEKQPIILQQFYLNYLPVTVSSNMLPFRLLIALTFTWISGTVIRENLAKFVQRNRILGKIFLIFLTILLP